MGNKFYTLEEVANWQLKSDSLIKLPSLQRSFVWKPSQIETIWDSILRGFPIGSFLLSEATNGELDLMDGQQRSTSIALGFYNPWDENDATNFLDAKNRENAPTVWIDINPTEVTETHKYLVRVLTKSHPWGYQRKNNQTILSVGSRNFAIKVFNNFQNVDKYTDFDKRIVYPIGAEIPVPLNFLLTFLEDTEPNITDFISKCSTLPFMVTDEDRKKNFIEYVSSSKFKSFYETIKKNICNYEIPAIVVKNELINDTDTTEENQNVDPTLFVRLNREGTRIDGEELLYSIYKSEFPQMKEVVENISADFIRPSLLISFYSRFYWSKLNNNTYQKKMTVNDFRKRIRQNEEYKNVLSKSLQEFELFFKKAINILSSDDFFKIPDILVKRLINNSPELFYGLVYWISHNSDHITKNIFSIKKRFVMLHFFANSNDFLASKWKDINSNTFWTDENFTSYENEGQHIFPIIDIEYLKSELKRFLSEPNLTWGNFYPQNGKLRNYFNGIFDEKFKDDAEREVAYRFIWDKHLNPLARNRDLLMLVQRDYFEERFKDFNSLEVLTDTNRPWDWDHIYPQNNVKGMRDIRQQIRELNNMNCNYRAISLEQNRADSDRTPPSRKFQNLDERRSFFIKDNDWEYWKAINGRVRDENQKNVLINAFVNRFINIIEDFYKMLNLS